MTTAVDRAEGRRQEMTAAGLKPRPDLLVHANVRVDGGRDALELLLAGAERPDAVLATNNLVGVGVLQALHARVGAAHDVGVADIGDLPFATSPVDTLVLLPLHPRAIGTRAARMFSERLRGLDAGPRHVVLPVDADADDATAAVGTA